jgi:drug/metabolite transporter (DMT)-like permease
MVLYRFLFASMGLLPVVLRNRARFRAAEMRLLVLSAAFGVPIQFLPQYYGLARTTVSHASLMVGAYPVMLGVGAAVFAGERLKWFDWLALSVSTLGAALVTLGGSGATTGRETPSLAGDLLVFLSLFAALAWMLLCKKLLETHSAPVVTAYTTLAGTGMLIVWVLGRWMLSPVTHQHLPSLPFAHVSATAWAALAISGLFCTATTTFLWNWGIHHVPASRAGVFMNLEPVLGAILGVALLGERLGPHAWAGGALILASAVALTSRGHRAEPEVILE